MAQVDWNVALDYVAHGLKGTSPATTAATPWRRQPRQPITVEELFLLNKVLRPGFPATSIFALATAISAPTANAPAPWLGSSWPRSRISMPPWWSAPSCARIIRSSPSVCVRRQEIHQGQSDFGCRRRPADCCMPTWLLPCRNWPRPSPPWSRPPPKSRCCGSRRPGRRDDLRHQPGNRPKPGGWRETRCFPGQRRPPSRRTPAVCRPWPSNWANSPDASVGFLGEAANTVGGLRRRRRP